MLVLIITPSPPIRRALLRVSDHATFSGENLRKRRHTDPRHNNNDLNVLVSELMIDVLEFEDLRTSKYLGASRHQDL